jgi:hypothetical protein
MGIFHFTSPGTAKKSSSDPANRQRQALPGRGKPVRTDTGGLETPTQGSENL